AEPSPGPGGRPEAGDVVAPERHPAGGGAEQPAAAVERGGLAGAVGADQTGEAPDGGGQVDVVEGEVPSIADAEVGDLEAGTVGRHQAAPSAGRATSVSSARRAPIGPRRRRATDWPAARS